MPARKYDFNHDDRPNKVKKRRRVQRPRRPRRPSNNRFIYLMIVAIVGGLGVLFLSRYARITSIRTDINDMEIELENLEKKKLNLKADLEGIKSSEKIEEEAELKLGMNHPTEDQILYISIPKEETSKNLLEKINGIITDITEKTKSLVGR